MQATLQEYPFSATGSINLVHKLKDAIMEVKIRNENEGALVLWMLFMGGVSARRGEDRIWFVAQIEKLSGRLGLGDWEAVNGEMQGLWWVEKIHEKPLREMWDEAVVLRSVTSGV